MDARSMDYKGFLEAAFVLFSISTSFKDLQIFNERAGINYDQQRYKQTPDPYSIKNHDETEK